jgi:hypothetical protein
MAGKRIFLAGVTVGAIGGFLAGTRLANRHPQIPFLNIGQQVLAETRGAVKAALLAARVQVRYDQLYAHRPRFQHLALRKHLEVGILPGLALYQTLCEENSDQEAALAEFDRILTALVERSGRREIVQIIGRLFDPFAILRIMNRWGMRWIYPPAGWRFEWVEDNDQCIAYNARECFYLNVLTEYGALELLSHFCAVDDLLFDDFPGVSWERTMTLGRGDDRCNFRFCRENTSLV